MSSRAIAHPLVSGALNAKRPWAIGRDFTVHVLKGGFWLLSTSGIEYFYHVPQWVRIIRV